MKRPDDKVIKSLAFAVRQNPEILDWIESWCEQELERLPYSKDNWAVQAGRSQVLMELRKLLTEAPELAAKR